MKRDIPCKLSGEKHVKIRINNVRNAAYAYSYWMPISFKEVIVNHDKYTDTEFYVSPDKKCSLKIWPGQTINFPSSQVDSTGKFIGVNCADILRVDKAVSKYIRLIKAGRDRQLQKIRIVEFKEGIINGYNHQIALKGIANGYGYIYKIEVSEIPVSGDLIFKHFLYKYDYKSRDKYEGMGIAMANRFSEF